MSAPTHEDAMVLIQMFQLGTSMNMRKANQFMWSDDFIEDYQEFIKKYPQGSKEHGYMHRICGWYETIGSFWKAGVLHPDLIEGSLWISGVWGRAKNFALGSREASGDPRIYEYFEALAEGFPAPE